MRELGLGLALLGTASLGASAACGDRPLPVQISDEFTSPKSPPQSVEAVANAPFRTFIDATLGSLNRSAKFGDGKARPHLRFVRIALASSGDESPPVPIHRGEEAPGACIVKSPWVEAVVSPETGAIDGTAYWSERQVLLDRAQLGGSGHLPWAPREALAADRYSAFAQAYADSEIMRKPGAPSLADAGLPPEVLWLFRHSPQSTRGPFEASAQGAMQRIAEASAATYGELVAVLLARCFETPKARYEYDNINEVRDAIDLEKVKMI